MAFHFICYCKCYISDCMCRREVCNWLLAASCFTSKVLHHTSDYRPALSLVSLTSNFSERLSTFTYSYQESCNLYPRCTPYFSVEHTLSPQSTVSISSSWMYIVWSTPSSTWWGVWATSPLPPHSLATRGETSLLWKAQSCKVNDCNWSEGGQARRLDWELAFISSRHNTYCLMDIHNGKIVWVTYIVPTSSVSFLAYMCQWFDTIRHFQQ